MAVAVQVCDNECRSGATSVRRDTLILDHVTDEDVRGLLMGRLGPEERNRVVWHLLGGCQSCQQRFSASAMVEEIEHGAKESYDEVLDQVFAVALEQEAPRWEREKAQLARLLAAASSCPGGILELPPEVDEDLNGWPLVEALLRSSFEARFRDLEEMRILAFAAMVAARNLKPGRYSPEMILDLQARAWGELGNAYRLNHEFEDSDDAFAQASDLWEKGSGDLMILARLLDLQGSLRSSQRRLADALEHLNYACQLYLQLGERHLAGRVLIKRGISTSCDGRPEEAAQLLHEGISLIDSDRDSQLSAIGRYELIHSLVDCGRFQEAGRILLKSDLRQAFSSQPLNLLKLRWLEAKISMGMERLPKAENALRKVQGEFLRHGQEYDAALVGLDLAEVLLRRGEAAEVRLLAREILETFEDLGIQPEALKAMRYLRAACDRELATPGMVQRVVGFLRRLEWQPQLRFAP